MEKYQQLHVVTQKGENVKLNKITNRKIQQREQQIPQHNNKMKQAQKIHSLNNA